MAYICWTIKRHTRAHTVWLELNKHTVVNRETVTWIQATWRGMALCWTDIWYSVEMGLRRLLSSSKRQSSTNKTFIYKGMFLQCNKGLFISLSCLRKMYFPHWLVMLTTEIRAQSGWSVCLLSSAVWNDDLVFFMVHYNCVLFVNISLSLSLSLSCLSRMEQFCQTFVSVFRHLSQPASCVFFSNWLIPHDASSTWYAT